MLSAYEINPDTRRRRALGKVYALLIRLAEENEKPTTFPENIGKELTEQGQQFPKVRKSGYELQGLHPKQKTEDNDGN
jgi:hypothetical protein